MPTFRSALISQFFDDSFIGWFSYDRPRHAYLIPSLSARAKQKVSHRRRSHSPHASSQHVYRLWLHEYSSARATIASCVHKPPLLWCINLLLPRLHVIFFDRFHFAFRTYMTIYHFTYTSRLDASGLLFLPSGFFTSLSTITIIFVIFITGHISRSFRQNTLMVYLPIMAFAAFRMNKVEYDIWKFIVWYIMIHITITFFKCAFSWYFIRLFDDWATIFISLLSW